jgi:hypothetical protein
MIGETCLWVNQYTREIKAGYIELWSFGKMLRLHSAYGSYYVGNTSDWDYWCEL